MGENDWAANGIPLDRPNAARMYDYLLGGYHNFAIDRGAAEKMVAIDPDTVRHSEAILRETPHTAVIQADIRQLDQILDHPDVRHLLDFSQPVAVLFALLHFVTEDEQAYNLVRVLRNDLPPASCFAISHGTDEETPSEIKEQVEALYARSTTPVKLRSRAEVAAFFDGLDLVEPGVIYEPLWRPEGPDDLFLDQPERSATFVGVGCKP